MLLPQHYSALKKKFTPEIGFLVGSSTVSISREKWRSF
jgi:hypothetical protein